MTMNIITITLRIAFKTIMIRIKRRGKMILLTTITNNETTTTKKDNFIICNSLINLIREL